MCEIDCNRFPTIPGSEKRPGRHHFDCCLNSFCQLFDGATGGESVWIVAAKKTIVYSGLLQSKEGDYESLSHILSKRYQLQNMEGHTAIVPLSTGGSSFSVPGSRGTLAQTITLLVDETSNNPSPWVLGHQDGDLRTKEIQSLDHIIHL